MAWCVTSTVCQVPQVRLHAAAALERLAEPGEDGSFLCDPVTKAYRKILKVERNKDVRKCVLGVMPIVAGLTLEVGETCIQTIPGPEKHAATNTCFTFLKAGSASLRSSFPA